MERHNIESRTADIVGAALGCARLVLSAMMLHELSSVSLPAPLANAPLLLDEARLRYEPSLTVSLASIVGRPRHHG